MNPKTIDVSKCVLAIYQIDYENKEECGSLPELRIGIFENNAEQSRVIAYYNSKPFDNFYEKKVKIVIRDDIEKPINLSSICGEKEIDKNMAKRILESYAQRKASRPLYDDGTILEEMEEFEHKLYSDASLKR